MASAYGIWWPRTSLCPTALSHCASSPVTQMRRGVALRAASSATLASTRSLKSSWSQAGEGVRRRGAALQWHRRLVGGNRVEARTRDAGRHPPPLSLNSSCDCGPAACAGARPPACVRPPAGPAPPQALLPRKPRTTQEADVHADAAATPAGLRRVRHSPGLEVRPRVLSARRAPAGWSAGVGGGGPQRRRACACCHRQTPPVSGLSCPADPCTHACAAQASC